MEKKACFTTLPSTPRRIQGACKKKVSYILCSSQNENSVNLIFLYYYLFSMSPASASAASLDAVTALPQDDMTP